VSGWPLRESTGEAVFNEVFIDKIFVPAEDVVSVAGQGGAVAGATLGNERVSIGGSGNSGLSAAGLVELQQRHATSDAGLVREIGGVAAAEHPSWHTTIYSTAP
jgi:alkylation response protein AidB-like acyl-CoA dehydrogenase